MNAHPPTLLLTFRRGRGFQSASRRVGLDGPSRRYWGLVRDYGVRILGTLAEWSEDAEAALEATSEE